MSNKKVPTYRKMYIGSIMRVKLESGERFTACMYHSVTIPRF
jgi:hypothetical protein